MCIPCHIQPNVLFGKQIGASSIYNLLTMIIINLNHGVVLWTYECSINVGVIEQSIIVNVHIEIYKHIYKIYYYLLFIHFYEFYEAKETKTAKIDSKETKLSADDDIILEN